MLYSQHWQLFNVVLSEMRTMLLGSGNLLYMNLNQI